MIKELNIEKKLKRSLLKFKYKPNKYFSGSTTEVFKLDSLTFIDKELKKFKCK